MLDALMSMSRRRGDDAPTLLSCIAVIVDVRVGHNTTKKCVSRYADTLNGDVMQFPPVRSKYWVGAVMPFVGFPVTDASNDDDDEEASSTDDRLYVATLRLYVMPVKLGANDKKNTRR